MDELRKILVIDVSGIGDIIMSIPALRALRKRYPESYIAMLVSSRACPLLFGCPYVDEVFAFNISSFKFSPAAFNFAETFKSLASVVKLKHKHFDAVVNLYAIDSYPGNLRMALLFKYIAVKIKVGRRHGTMGNFYTASVNEGGIDSLHEAERMIKAVNLLGADSQCNTLELWGQDCDKVFARNLLAAHNILENDFLLGVAAGTLEKQKQWLPERFAVLLDMVADRYKVKIVFFGSKGERPSIEEIILKMKTKAFNFAGKCNLKHAVWLIKRCDAFICVDSGPMHIASVFKVPTIALFGPSLPLRFAPYNNENAVIVKKGSNMGSISSMRAIDTENVFEAFEGLIIKIKSLRPKVKITMHRKIKVLHTHTLPVISGSGINTLLTMSGLNKARYNVEFACAPNGRLIDEAKAQEISFHPIRHFVQPVSVYHDIMALIELIFLMRRRRYDIVHSHNSKAGFITRLAAKLARIPIIIHTIHGFAFHDFEQPSRRGIFIALERFAAPFADKLIVISKPLMEWGLRLKIGKPEQYVTIYSGIDLGRFNRIGDIADKKREFAIPSQAKVIGVVSKLWEGKGHKCVLLAIKQIVSRIPDIKFMFVGEGYLRKDLENLSLELGIRDHIVFTGFRNDIVELTAIFDIAVLASFFEGMGRVLLEAMALGKPVVASKVGGIVDIVEDRVTGILVPAGDVNALTGAIIELLENEQMRKKMGEAGRRTVDEKFNVRTMVCQIEDAYEEILYQKGLCKIKEP
ncbi:MAG: glycosyltransferase [Candidatus Omnitrophota bacterium]